MEYLMPDASAALACEPRGRLLIVNDAADELGDAMMARGFVVRCASSVADGLVASAREAPDYALLDVRVGGESGLALIGALRTANPDVRIVIFSSYGDLANAVAAIKAGATDYLTKPASPDAIENALVSSREPLPPPIALPLLADEVRWEHIRSVFTQAGRNVSETARRLRMHRRTLQRILAKGEPRRVVLARE